MKYKQWDKDRKYHNYYCLYDYETEEFVIGGNSREIAEYLGYSDYRRVHCYMCLLKKGRIKKLIGKDKRKYLIVQNTTDEMESDEEW